MNRAAMLLAMSLLPAAALVQAEPASRPATEPAPPQGPCPQEAKIERVLADQEAAGEKLAALSARMIHRTVDVFEDVVEKTGRFAYRKPNQFRIEFEFKTIGKHTLLEGKTYIFNGRTLYLLNSPAKRLTIYELPPADDGEAADSPLELGKGPFPMPFGQKAETIRRLFEVSLVPAEADEPDAGLIHLRLDPKPDADVGGMRWVELWFDEEIKLPVKLRFQDKAETVTTVWFPKAELTIDDPAVTAEQFAEPQVNPNEWEIIRQPL